MAAKYKRIELKCGLEFRNWVTTQTPPFCQYKTYFINEFTWFKMLILWIPNHIHYISLFDISNIILLNESIWCNTLHQQRMGIMWWSICQILCIADIWIGHTWASLDGKQETQGGNLRAIHKFLILNDKWCGTLCACCRLCVWVKCIFLQNQVVELCTCKCMSVMGRLMFHNTLLLVDICLPYPIILTIPLKTLLALWNNVYTYRSTNN